MASFWGQRVPDSLDTKAGLYTPCGALPPETAQHTWVHEIKVGYERQDGSMAGPANVSSGSKHKLADDAKPVKSKRLRRIGPAWEAVPQDDEVSVASALSGASSASYLKIPARFRNSFFLSSDGQGAISSATARDEASSIATNENDQAR